MFSWTRPHRVPLIVAHRGSSAEAPENTMAAFRRAIDDGADAIELDVRLSLDGEPFVFHDARLYRMTGSRGIVGESTAERLRSLSPGARFSPLFAGERIPALGDVLRLARNRVGLNIELKADISPARGGLLLRKCCALVAEMEMESQVLLSSFDHSLVRGAREIAPGIPAGLLLHPFRPGVRSPVASAAGIGCAYVVFGARSLRKRLIAETHTRGLLAAEYTINTAFQLARAVRFGVDAVITDRPALIRKWLGERQ